MDKRVFIIGNTDRFMLNALSAELKDMGLNVALIKSLEEGASLSLTDSDICILYLCAAFLEAKPALSLLAKNLSDSGAAIYLIGHRDELDAAKTMLPDSSRLFDKPIKIRLLKDAIQHEFSGETSEDRSRILVVDDDSSMLHIMDSMLKPHFCVFLANSGNTALNFLTNYTVDLILLDIRMPGMDGFETISRIRQIPGRADIPVVFLTANDDQEIEKEGLTAGAADFIRKPFLPDVLLLRVRNIVELEKLRRQLSNEVEKKTAEVVKKNMEIRHMALELVQTLSGAIDAKDTYTNGHSRRVAEYSEEIGRRFGYSPEQLDDLYVAGLLHDVGKIGIPDEIINKTSRLTDSEFAIIKTHPAIGAEILKNVTSMPNVAVGAHWHHERYDGKGYPDALKGEDIPEIARIIGVADAYDAMSSNRSYRSALPQEKVRQEVENGKGKQFSPEFADIMLQMIDEDKNYQLREL